MIDSQNLLLDIQTALYAASAKRDDGMADLERAIGTAIPDETRPDQTIPERNKE